MRKFSYIICASIFCHSCGWLQEDPPLTVDDPIVIAAAQARLQQYIDVRIEMCREDLLEEAEIKVDSIITELIEQYMQDTIYFPVKPVRPDFPDKLKPDSSLNPKPIFDSIPPIKKNVIAPPDSVIIDSDTLQR